MISQIQITGINWEIAIPLLTVFVTIAIFIFKRSLKRKDDHLSDFTESLKGFISEMDQYNEDVLMHQQNKSASQKDLERSREHLSSRQKALGRRREQMLIAVPEKIRKEWMLHHQNWLISCTGDTGLIVLRKLAWDNHQAENFRASCSCYAVWLSTLRSDVIKGRIKLM